MTTSYSEIHILGHTYTRDNAAQLRRRKINASEAWISQQDMLETLCLIRNEEHMLGVGRQLEPHASKLHSSQLKHTLPS